MILLTLLLIPIIGIFIILTGLLNVTLTGSRRETSFEAAEDSNFSASSANGKAITLLNRKRVKTIALTVSIINMIVSLVLFIFFDYSTNQFQFVQEYHEISHFHIYLGVDGLSIYFVLLTTIITPIALLSN